MSDSDLGPKPDPVIEPGDPEPGGVDAITDTTSGTTDDPGPDPLARDLDPDDNPAVEDALPEEMKQGEDTSTKATRADDAGDADSDADAEEDSPA